MNDGVISSNSAPCGGGVYTCHLFRIVTGTIYGINEAVFSNYAYAENGWVLYMDHSGLAQYGTFIGETWNGIALSLTAKNSDFYTDNTIKAVNGNLQ
jgi:hypothetical protein